MLEIYFDDRGAMAIDNLEELMDAFPQYAERATASALRSEGFRLKEAMQFYIQSAPGLGYWPENNPHTGILNLTRNRRRKWHLTTKNYRMVWRGQKGKKKRVREYWGVKYSTKTSPLTRLRGGIRYVYDNSSGVLHVGFVNQADRVLRMVKMQAQGYTTRVTPRMRRWFFAMGFPLKKETTTLRTPPRPLIDPVWRREEKTVIANLKKKYINNVVRYMAGEANRQVA